MSKTIYKYPFEVVDEFTVDLPDADILCVQVQGDTPCMWALVNPEAKPRRRTFLLRGTGHDCADQRIRKATHVGTFQLHGGKLVFHLFEAREL